MLSFELESPRIKERTVAKNSLAVAFLSHMPIVPGHLLICPKRAAATSSELSIDEWQAILQLRQQVCEALVRAFGAEGFNFAWNEGDKAGQSVSHFHLHVVPRREGDAGVVGYEPRIFLYRPGRREISPAEELKQVAQLIISKLED